jgi:negative regulator of genetic competence, sporulation and motility
MIWNWIVERVSESGEKQYRLKEYLCLTIIDSMNVDKLLTHNVFIKTVFSNQKKYYLFPNIKFKNTNSPLSKNENINSQLFIFGKKLTS